MKRTQLEHAIWLRLIRLRARLAIQKRGYSSEMVKVLAEMETGEPK